MSHSLSESRILVCDDSITNSLILQKLLESDGYTQVQAVTDSTQVLPIMQQQVHDLLLLDIEMPQLDGFGVMALLRAELAGVDMIPILVLTGRQGVEVRNRALDAGAHDFVTKPFDQEEVLLRVRNLLRVRHAFVTQQALAKELERKVENRTRELTTAADILVEKLAMAGEMRDKETGQHVLRVGKYARVLAEAVGLPAEIAFMIEKAAPLHDLGKIAIPDHILLKSGALNEDERSLMNTHAERGAELLAGHQSLLVQMAASIARSHHEKWDGTGYPSGLSGESIPIEGRITAISDVFDALTSKRPYKGAWSIEDAVAHIQQQTGSHFDPTLVQLFEDHLKELIEIRNTYDD